MASVVQRGRQQQINKSIYQFSVTFLKRYSAQMFMFSLWGVSYHSFSSRQHLKQRDSFYSQGVRSSAHLSCSEGVVISSMINIGSNVLVVWLIVEVKSNDISTSAVFSFNQTSKVYGRAFLYRLRSRILMSSFWLSRFPPSTAKKSFLLINGCSSCISI